MERFPCGVELAGPDNTYNEINCTGIGPAALPAGAPIKLLINGVPTTNAGLSETNLASGVMA